MEEESISIVCDEIKKRNTGVIASYTSLLKTEEIDIDNRILSEIIDFNLKNKDPNFSELINEFTPKNMFKTAQILLERGEKKNAIKILQNCMIKCYPDKDENNIVKDETTLKACFDKFKELKINLLDNFEPIKNIKSIDSQNSKTIETYLTIIQFSLEENLNNIENINKICEKTYNVINAINGDYSKVNGENKDNKDLLLSIYNTTINFLEFNFEMTYHKYIYEVLKMAELFAMKGSTNVLGKLLEKYNKIGNITPEEKSKFDKKIFTELIDKKLELINYCYDKTNLEKTSPTFFFSLLPYIFELDDDKKIKEFLIHYKKCIEFNRDNNQVSFSTIPRELTRAIDVLMSNKNVSISRIENYEEQLKDLCDYFPYGHYKSDRIATDKIEKAISKRKFNDTYNKLYELKTIIEKNKKEVVNLSLKIENKNDEIEIDKAVEKTQILANEILKNEETLKNEVKDFFDEIENGYLHYSFISDNIKEFEKIEDLVPTFKGKIKEILTNIIQKQFEEKINSLNELFSKEKTEDRDKKINREIISLAKFVNDVILSEKCDIDLGSNKSNIKNFFDNLEANSNNLFLSLNTLEYEEELEKIKSVLIEKNKTAEENKAEFEEIKNVLEKENEISEIDKSDLETYIGGLNNSASDLFISIKKEEQVKLEQTEKSFANSIEIIDSLGKPIDTPIIGN